MLILMTHEKLGDFLLLTSHLCELQQKNPELIIAIPSLLYELYKEEKIFSRFIHAKEAKQYAKEQNLKILDLTYPLLDSINLPQDHWRLDKDIFKKPQHSIDSYSQALRLWFKGFPADFKAEPFLDLNLDEKVLMDNGLEAFQYFTVHSGSDFAPKNWAPDNFEKTIEMLVSRYPHLQCVHIIGPQDEELFKNKQSPIQLINVRLSLRDVAHVLSASLFHIDNDSGIHHLAGALDVPSITVFGPTGPGTWSSMTQYNFIHWGGPSCADHCNGSRMRTCSNRICLSSILPEHLLVSADRIIKGYHENSFGYYQN